MKLVQSDREQGTPTLSAGTGVQKGAAASEVRHQHEAKGFSINNNMKSDALSEFIISYTKSRKHDSVLSPTKGCSLSKSCIRRSYREENIHTDIKVCSAIDSGSRSCVKCMY